MGHALDSLGYAHRDGGEVVQADGAWRRADEILTELCHPDVQRARDRLALGPSCPS